MKLELHRIVLTEKSTLGELFVDGVFECYTLEDVVRELGPQGQGKVWGETAIPAGTYVVTINHSPKFGRLLPRLLDVPHFDGILIHKGNTPENTLGCILVGMRIGSDSIHESTVAFERLYEKMWQAQFEAGDPISITITNNF